MLNVGAPSQALQQLLGHGNVNVTLVYGRVYDSTVAAHYYRVMGQIKGASDQLVNGQDPLTLLNVLQSDEFNETEQEAAQALRIAVQALNLTASSTARTLVRRHGCPSEFCAVGLDRLDGQQRQRPLPGKRRVHRVP